MLTSAVEASRRIVPSFVATQSAWKIVDDHLIMRLVIVDDHLITQLVIVDDQTHGEGEARARTIDLISVQLSTKDLIVIVYRDPRSSLDRRLS